MGKNPIPYYTNGGKVMGIQGEIQNVPLLDAEQLLNGFIHYLDDKRERQEIVKYILAGSYRRAKETINDVDIVISVEADILKEQTLIDIAKQPFVKKVASVGKVKGTFILTNGLQVDVYMTLPQNMGAMLMYFTGSQFFNIALRAKAKRVGWKLNELQLEDATGEMFASEEETPIFEQLGLNFIPPEERSIADGDWSAANKLFAKYKILKE